MITANRADRDLLCNLFFFIPSLPEHPKQTVDAETHRFVNGICEQCGAPNYSDVVMDLPVEKRVPVALGDTNAKLSAGNIRLTLGSANITDEYDLNYFWYDYSQGGRPVGEGQEYPRTYSGWTPRPQRFCTAS